jgi:hypothetical protein
MKRVLVVVTSITLLSFGFSDAQAARIRFWGGMVITNTGTGCGGNETNRKFAVRFRSAGVGDGTTSTISLFESEQAYNFQVSGVFNSTFKDATTVAIHDYGGAPPNQVKIKFTSQSPVNITSTTQNIFATGQISGWDEQPTCTLTFRLALTRRQES